MFQFVGSVVWGRWLLLQLFSTFVPLLRLSGANGCCHSLVFLRGVAQLSATFVFSFVPQLYPAFVSQSFEVLGSIGRFLPSMFFGFLWKASPTVVHIFLAIFLERFPELLLHWSLSFCSSPVHMVLVSEQVSGINSGTITLFINRKILKGHTVLKKKSIHPSPIQLHSIEQDQSCRYAAYFQWTGCFFLLFRQEELLIQSLKHTRAREIYVWSQQD